ncbi:hypothetical protein BGX28_003104 [Mortierella sp. GBA30]|nr:hypothetical protein BGX28_003104 [Mortierella sp. GBA30]
MAGRFGLELQHSLEQAQLAERQSYAQLQALQDENLALQSRAHHQAVQLNSHLNGSEDEVANLTSENESLQKELDGCRRELKLFRKELDGLVEQMSEMGTEVLDAKTKVSVYSRRVNEVEQELTTTQELNVNLQEQLRVTLEKQKQTQTSTAMAMKNMQSELGKVVSDSGTIRSTLEELETRQDKCEGKVVEMISNTKEYAQLLEEAQTTIQTMRVESDMEGRGWLLPLASPSRRKKSVGQLSTLAMEDPELDNSHPDNSDLENEEVVETRGMSLGMELGLGVIINQPKEKGTLSSPPPTPASLAPSATCLCSQPLTPATSPQVPMITQPKQQQQQRLTDSPEPLATPVSTQSRCQKFPTPTPPSPIATQLQQRLEEHNILQNVLSSSLPSSMVRPPWNPSVSLENVLPPSIPPETRSRSSSRAATIVRSMSSSRGSSRSVSQMSLHAISSSAKVGQRQQTAGLLSTLQASSASSSSSSRSKSSPSSTSSLTETIVAKSGKHQQNVTTASKNSKNGRQTRPRRSTTATATTTTKTASTPTSNNNSYNGSSTTVSNAMTKTKTANSNGIKAAKYTPSAIKEAKTP